MYIFMYVYMYIYRRIVSMKPSYSGNGLPMQTGTIDEHAPSRRRVVLQRGGASECGTAVHYIYIYIYTRGDMF